MRVPLELAVFGLAVTALFAAGAPVTALVLAVLVVVNAVLIAAFRQPEQWPTAPPSLRRLARGGFAASAAAVSLPVLASGSRHNLPIAHAETFRRERARAARW